MGRRALRKEDPNLDLTPFLTVVEDWPDDCGLASLLPRAAPLEVEIGSGKGLFLANASQARPDHNFVGIEIAGKYARHAAARLAKLKAPNALVAHGDAQRVLDKHLTPDSLHAVHIYFPDPWWKKRHHKRRIMSAPVVQRVEQLLMPGGRLHFWTDVQEYFEQSLELLREETTFRGPIAVEERAAAHDLDFQTHFERRMRLHGKPVYRAEFEKPGPEAA